MIDTPDPVSHLQSPRNAWINSLRVDVLRADELGVEAKAMATIASVAVWIASYADADGSNAYPSQATLAKLSGTSVETVRNVVKVLIAVRVLSARRRSGENKVYRLLQIIGGQPDWAAHISLLTDTRQRRDHAKRKAVAMAEAVAKAEREARTASVDAVRTASTVGDPDSVRGGLSGEGAEDPDSVRGRPPTASVDAMRMASAAGGDHSPRPTDGTIPPDTTRFGSEPEPPDARAPAREALRIVPTSPGGGRARTGGSAVQPPLLISAPTEPPPGLPEPDTPLRCSGCGYPRGWRPDDITLCAHCRTRQLDTG